MSQLGLAVKNAGKLGHVKDPAGPAAVVDLDGDRRSGTMASVSVCP
jgi:hypothetical protein